MTAAREAVLARVRAALTDGASVPEVARAYRERGERDRVAIVALFRERLLDYATEVVELEELGSVFAGRRLVVPADLPSGLVPPGVETLVDDGLTAAELDDADGALTTCAAACAETGTIALAGGPGEGRRILSLVPDCHVCLVPADRIVETVPELVAALEPAAREGRPIVLVSGPSATSDIELERVEGVHGPRRLVVSIV